MNIRLYFLSALGLIASMLVCCTTMPTPAPPTPTPETPDPQMEPWPEQGMEGKLYLNNGKVQVGIDLDKGGCIFHFSEVEKKSNIINHYDMGRMVQQSYYGNSDGSIWASKKWKYNPVQAGGYKGECGKVIESSTEQTLTYELSTPMHWANNTLLEECTMEQTIYLKDKIAKIHYKFCYNGEVINNIADQELPACFVDWDYAYLAYYAGTKPWGGEDLTIFEVPSSTSATGTKISEANWTEKWAAYINKAGWGVGIYSPSSIGATYYRYGNGNSTGCTGSDCSYIAPLGSFALSPGFVYEYDVYLTIGTVGQIRNNFSTLAIK